MMSRKSLVIVISSKGPMLYQFFWSELLQHACFFAPFNECIALLRKTAVLCFDLPHFPHLEVDKAAVQLNTWLVTSQTWEKQWHHKWLISRTICFSTSFLESAESHKCKPELPWASVTRWPHAKQQPGEIFTLWPLVKYLCFIFLCKQTEEVWAISALCSSPETAAWNTRKDMCN